MVREQCVALHVVQLAVAGVRQLRRRRGNVLRRIQAQQVVEPRLHLIPSPIPAMTQSSEKGKLRLWRLSSQHLLHTIWHGSEWQKFCQNQTKLTSAQCMHGVAE